MLNKFVYLSFLRAIKILLSVGSLLVFARIVGVNDRMDIWVLAFAIVTGAGMIIWGALNEVLRSRYIKIRDGKPKTELIKYTTSLHVGALIINLSIIIVAVAVFFIYSNLGGYDPDVRLSQVLMFTALLSPSLILSQYVAVSTCLMNCEGKIYQPEIIGVCASIINISIVFFGYNDLGIFSLALGYYTYLFICSLYAHYFNTTNGLFYFKWLTHFKLSYFLPFVGVAGYLIAAYASGQLNVFVEKSLSANMDEGVVSLVNYASQIKGSLQAVFSSVLLSIVVPIMTLKYIKKDNSGYVKALDQGQAIIFGILILVIPVITSSSSSVAEIIFSNNALTAEQKMAFETLLQGYIFALYPVLLYVIYGCALVSIGKEREYAILAIICQFVSILFTLVFVNIFSFKVFPLSLFVSHLIVAFIMMYNAKINLTNTIRRVLVYAGIILILSIALKNIKLNFFQVALTSPITDLSFSVLVCGLAVALILFLDKGFRQSVYHKF
jgi:putative peptidoglycan lipid II flippase